MPDPAPPSAASLENPPGSPSWERPSRHEHVQALLLAIACAVLFLRDGLLPGHALVPHPPELFDVHMAEAQASGSFDPDEVFRGNVGMTDKYLQSLCWDRVMQDRLRAGELPLWTRDIGGGAPFVPQMAQPWQPINTLLLVLSSAEWYGVWYLIHLVLFGWFAYLFVRRLGCRHTAALLALVVASLGMWTQCKLHHNVILTAALSLWPMLSAVHELVVQPGDAGASRSRSRSRATFAAIAWLGLWTGLSWSTGFVVVALQATYLTVAFALFCALRTPKGTRLRRLLPVGFGLALGALISLANMLPILLASSESSRDPTFDLQLLRGLGLEWDHLLTMVWPDLLSWPADVFYPEAANPNGYATRMPWTQLALLENPLRPAGVEGGDNSAFQNWVETSFALGAVSLGALASALCSRVHRATAWFFALLALFAFGIATADEPFFSIARLLPGITAGDLRRLLFSVAMPLVVLTGLGADAWLQERRLLPARLVWFAVATASIVALSWLWQNSSDDDFVRAYAEIYAADSDHPTVQAASQHPRVATAAAGEDRDRALVDLVAAEAQRAAKPGEIAANHAMLSLTAWRTLGVAVLAFGLSFVLRNVGVWLWLLLAAAIAELVLAGIGPVQTVPAERITRVPTVLQPVAEATATCTQEQRARPRLQRLVLAGSGESALPGNMPGFLGIEDANAYNPLPKARYEDFFEFLEPGCSRGGSGVGAFRKPDSLQHPLCDLFGIRYVLTRDAVAIDGERVVDRTPAGTGGFRLLERTTVLPRATFVDRVDIATTADERRKLLADPSREVAHRIVLERDDAPQPEGVDQAVLDLTKIELVYDGDERVVVRIRNEAPGYLRLADPYDAGFYASIDGVATEIFAADHYLRAVYLPEPGEHEIVFRYDGPRAVWPLRLTLCGYAIAAALLLLAAFAGRRPT